MDDHNEERMEEAYDEAELSDDEFEELSFDDLLDRVESNSPCLTNLKFGLSTLVQNNDDHRHRLERLERLSTAIGRNTHLKALMFNAGGARLDDAHAMNFLRGIACNQSIKRLHFNNCGEYLGNACRILTPLFKNNQVERIRIQYCNLSPEGIRLLTTSLAEFDSLKECALTGARIQHNQQAARELMQSLGGHSGLRKLDLHSDITQAGWQAIFDALSNSSCMLRKLSLSNNTINDAAAQSLSNALTSNRTLKTLNLAAIWGITLIGWRVLFGALRSPTCVLVDLDLRNNQLNDEVIVSLTNALASNRSLKSLNLSSIPRFTGDGWQTFFSTFLSNPSSGLEKLELCWCSLNDAAILALTNALVNNSKLKVLILQGNNLITDTGWKMFCSVLESPNTALEELDLQFDIDDNDIDDDTVTLLVNSLAGNKKLKKLAFRHSGDWEPPMSVICNSDDIMSTYNSNHTLEALGRGDRYLPDDLAYMLKINRENSPNQAARLKIIKTQFKDCFITQPFVGMDLNVLPHAMAWMGRDGRRTGEVDGHYLSFIKSISSLFENVN